MPNHFSWADPFGLSLCRATHCFTLKKAKVETAQGKQAIDVSTVDEFRAAVLDGVRSLYALGSAEVAEDRKPLDDLAAVIREVRELAPLPLLTPVDRQDSAIDLVPDDNSTHAGRRYA